MNDTERAFLDKAADEATAAQHPFPKAAACEAALESTWGKSELAREGNNLFGMKQHRHPDPALGSMTLPTREFLDSHWTIVDAQWPRYPNWSACFTDRLGTLKRLAATGKYPHYAAALAAKDAQSYVTEVSKTWSTDPERANKVLTIYQQYVAGTTNPGVTS